MQNQPLKPIAIIGAGSWGTALALYLSRRGQIVRVFSIDPTEINAMVAEKANNRYLPGIVLPNELQAFLDLAETVQDVDDIIMVVPSVGVRKMLELVKPLIPATTRITLASKGIDTDTGQLLSDVVTDVLGHNRPYAVLSGPSFAREVAHGLPCAVVIASKYPALLKELTARFDSPIFRIHQSEDIIGVEVGGAVKNVIAIATGICDGMELGSNARSALITFGLAEIIRLGTVLGGKTQTFIGLAGLGDLILTCSDNQSRNRRLGLAIGKGRNIEEAEKEIGQVVEGRRNAELVSNLAAQHNINMPIVQAVWDILQGKMPVQEGFRSLLARCL